MYRTMPGSTTLAESLSSTLNATSRSILLCGEDDFSIQKYCKRLQRFGFSNVRRGKQPKNQNDILPLKNSDMAIIDITDCDDTSVLFLHTSFAKYLGHQGKIVFMAEQSTCETVHLAAKNQIDDFWIKGPSLKIDQEICCGFEISKQSIPFRIASVQLSKLGIFRSAGLTASEITLLKKWSSDFPRQRDFASQLCKTAPYVNKVFSRIYEKLDPVLRVDNPSKLAHLITICSLF